MSVTSQTERLQVQIATSFCKCADAALMPLHRVKFGENRCSNFRV